MDGAYGLPLALSQLRNSVIIYLTESTSKLFFKKKKDQRKQIPVNSKGSSIQSLY